MVMKVMIMVMIMMLIMNTGDDVDSPHLSSEPLVKVKVGHVLDPLNLLDLGDQLAVKDG